jgi:hypothetical protein
MVLVPATAGKQHAFTVAPTSQWVAGLTLTKAANKAALIAVAELKGLISARMSLCLFFCCIMIQCMAALGNGYSAFSFRPSCCVSIVHWF